MVMSLRLLMLLRLKPLLRLPLLIRAFAVHGRALAAVDAAARVVSADPRIAMACLMPREWPRGLIPPASADAGRLPFFFFDFRLSPGGPPAALSLLPPITWSSSPLVRFRRRITSRRPDPPAPAFEAEYDDDGKRSKNSRNENTTGRSASVRFCLRAFSAPATRMAVIRLVAQ